MAKHGLTLFIAHCTTLFYYVKVLEYIANIQPPLNDGKRGGGGGSGGLAVVQHFVDMKPKFFTIWGVAAQALLFALCVAHDAFSLLARASGVKPVRLAARSIRDLRDLVFVALSAPMATTVTLLFWGLCLVDRDLVMPVALDAVVPTWLNHAMHSFVLLLVAVQLLAEPHRAVSRRCTLALSAIVTLAYVYTLLGEYFQTGRWLYPVFEVLNWPGRAALVAFSVALNGVTVLAVRHVVRARWGHEDWYLNEGTKLIKTS